MLEKNIPGFRSRIIDEFEMSVEYSSLRTNETRDASKAILHYLASQGERWVRRNELTALFVAGGSDKCKRVQTRETGDKLIPGLADRQLQRILNRLIDGKFVCRKPKSPKSKRTPGRGKPDVYYYIHPTHIRTEDFIDGDVWELIPKNDDNLERERVGPHALITTIQCTKFQNFDGRELEDFVQAILKMFVHVDNELIRRWADELPLKERRLKASLLRYINEGGHVTRAYPPIE
jgi:hypothetical protein